MLDCNICPANCCIRNDGRSATEIYESEFSRLVNKLPLVVGEVIHIQPLSNGRCPSLDSNNLCSIYEDRPITCSTYPFTINKDDELFISTTCFSAMKIVDQVASGNQAVIKKIADKHEELKSLDSEVKDKMTSAMSNHRVLIRLKV